MHTTAQTIIDGLTCLLRGAFPDAQIFDDRKPQGVIPRAFSVRQISGNRRKRLGLLYSDGPARNRGTQSAVVLEIVYFPAAAVGKEEPECRVVLEELQDLLQLVPTADGVFIQGEDIDGNISDGALVVTVRFSYSTIYTPEENPLRKLKFTQGGLRDQWQ